MTTGRINQVTAALGLIIKKSYHNTRSADSRDLKYDTLYYSADAVLRPRHAEAGGFGVCLIFSCLFKICREAGQVLKKICLDEVRGTSHGFRICLVPRAANTYGYDLRSGVPIGADMGGTNTTEINKYFNPHHSP